MKKKIFAQLAKVTEQSDGTCIVRGRMTAEELDKSGEILDYEKSKPAIEKWRDETLQRSANKSLGNIRAMHGKVAAGIATAIEFDDQAKAVDIEAHVIDLQEAQKCITGVYTGFSIGGDYAQKWDDPVLKWNGKAAKRFVPEMAETSLVDNPCVGSATFTYVKADGANELRKFAGADLPQSISLDGLSSEQVQALTKAIDGVKVQKDAKTKRVSDEDLPASAFAYVGDEQDTATWKLPIRFGSAEKTKSHVKDALAGFAKTEIAPLAKHAVAQRLIAAAKKADIDPSGFAEEYIQSAYSHALQKRQGVGKLQKGMWDVGRLADMLMTLSYMQQGLEDEAIYENDESKIPAALLTVLRQLKQVFIDLATEEVNELVREEEAKASADKMAKRAPAFDLRKEVAKMTTKTLEKMAERLEKATPEELKKFTLGLIKAADHIAKAQGHLEKAQAAHEKMGEHLDGMKDCIGKAVESKMEKADKDHVAGHLEGMEKASDEMETAHDALEGALDDASSAASDDEDTHLKAADKSVSRQMAKMEKSFSKKLLAVQKTNETMLEKLFEGLNKAMSPASTTEAPVPARTAVAVEKTADGTGVPAQVIPIGQPAAPEISPVLPNGTPNPAFVNKAAASDGSASEAMLKKAQLQTGDPFPKDFGKGNL